MARKTKEAAAATREALLDAALTVFRDRGVGRTRLADVAAAAGVTRGALYWHFRDKAELLRGVCDRATLPLEAMLEQAGQTALADPLAALCALSLQALRQLTDHADTQAVFDLLFHKCEFTDEFRDIAQAQEMSRAACLSRVARVLQQAVGRGQLPADTDVQVAAQGLHAYIIGLMHEWVFAPQAYDLAGHAAALLDCYLAGLKAAPPRRRADAPSGG